MSYHVTSRRQGLGADTANAVLYVGLVGVLGLLMLAFSGSSSRRRA